MKENDPVAAYFDKLPETHKRQFEERASGANFNFQQRLTLACELGGASSGRLLDCAAGTGEITCALLKSGRFYHATVVDVSAFEIDAHVWRANHFADNAGRSLRNTHCPCAYFAK